jgi:hypothetical protein
MENQNFTGYFNVSIKYCSSLPYAKTEELLSSSKWGFGLNVNIP